MKLLDVFVPCVPVPWARPRFNNGRGYTPAKQKAMEALIRQHAAAKYPDLHPFEGAVALSLAVYLPRPKTAPRSRLCPTVKPDLDNLTKLALDALNGLVWRDDALIIEMTLRKFYAGHGGRGPGYQIIVEDMEAA